MVKEGLGTGPDTPKPRAIPRASSLFPAPKSPRRVRVSPGFKTRAKRAPKALVSSAEWVIINLPDPLSFRVER